MGELVGITWSDYTRDYCFITYYERAKLLEDTKTMLNVRGGNEGNSHRELGKARVRQDEEDASQGTCMRSFVDQKT